VESLKFFSIRASDLTRWIYIRFIQNFLQAPLPYLVAILFLIRLQVRLIKWEPFYASRMLLARTIY
jgi:hypothetical protein